MKRTNDHWELSANEMRWAWFTGWGAAILLFAVTQTVLQRRLDVDPPLALSISLLAFSLPMYFPTKVLQARRNFELTPVRYVVAAVIGAAIAGVLGFVFGL